MIDLTKITLEQANKIECALVMLEKNIKEQIDGNKALANDMGLPETTRNNLKGNAEWWEDVHELIYGEGEADGNNL